MQRKIEVIGDSFTDIEATNPETAPDANPPEFADHVNPPTETTETPNTAEGEVEATPVAEETPTTATEETATRPESRPMQQGAEDYITALQAELEEAKRRADEAEKRVLYLQADFQNFRRRTEERERETVRYANAEILKTLLPILDNFERAMQAAEQFRDYDKLVGGVSGTLKQMQSFLEKAGVKPIEALGQEFNPEFHEAIGATEDSDQPANTVAEEVQRGYILHDRVLRPTLVKVVQ